MSESIPDTEAIISHYVNLCKGKYHEVVFGKNKGILEGARIHAAQVQYGYADDFAASDSCGMLLSDGSV